jgi:uncharacterized protein
MEIFTLPISDVNGDRYIIYRPIIGLAFIGNHVMAQLSLAMAGKGPVPPHGVQKDALDFLHTVGFFETDIFPAEPARDFRPATAVLLLTNQCQLRCTYCYAAAGEFPRQELSFELGRTAIDYVYQTAVAMGWKTFEVAFHGGGEPSTAWKVMQACTDYARQMSLPAKITLTSNGIWSSRQTDWIITHLDGVCISMDGSRETQDRQRPFAAGGASSNRVMQTIAELDHHAVSYGIRMTSLAPWTSLPEDVRFICQETQCKSMQVEPAFYTGRGRHGQPGNQDAAAFVKAFLEALEIACQAGRSLHYSGARLGMVTSTFCTAPYDALVENAAGELVACYEVTSNMHDLALISTIGHVENNYVIVDEASRARLHKLITERRAACQDCFCYWSCAGDCYTRNLGTTQGHLQRGTRCEINRLLMEKLLLRNIANCRGVWRASPRYSTPSTIGIPGDIASA